MAFSTAMLGGALIAQYGFSLYPCELCLYQRYPYVAIVMVGLLGLRASEIWRRRLLWLCVALLMVDAGIAAYHTGVELGLIKGPSGCSASSMAGDSLEELRKQIMNAPLVTCDQAMGYVFGLSLAAWNALMAMVMAVYLGMRLWRRR